MKKFISLYILLQISIITTNAKDKELVGYVNTLQGTNSSFELTGGNTYPHHCIALWYAHLDITDR